MFKLLKKMISKFGFFLVASLFLVNVAETEFIVAAYLPEYRFGVDFQVLASRVTDLILFSLEPSADGALQGLDRISADTMQRARAACNEHNTRLFVSIGGGGRSHNFQNVAAFQSTRQRFANTVADYVVQNDLDGVDIDWEAPRGQGDAANANVLRLLQDVSTELTKRRTTTRKLYLTTAVHADDKLAKDMAKHVDRVHLMTYDSCASMPCRHATFEMTSKALKTFSTKIAPRKLVVGIPAYGRDMQKPQDAITYEELVRDHGPIERDMDEDAKHRYYFNGIETVSRKTRLAHEKGALGVFFWEAGQDTTSDSQHSLINAARQVANSFAADETKSDGAKRNNEKKSEL